MKKLLLILVVLLSITCAHAQIWSVGRPNADDVTATLSNDTLYIRGTGEMQGIASPCPWQGITHAVIETGVTSIGGFAFDACTALTSVDISESVTTIGSGAFIRCSALTSVDIPESVTTIGVQAFRDCSSLTSVVIPDGVASIGSMTFSGCSSLTSVIIPESVTGIGSQAFNGCSSLASIDIPASVTNIATQAFQYCTSLTSVVIPDGITTIPAQVFSGCSSLTSVDIPESVTSIGSAVFYNCSALTSITIPDGVTRFEYATFFNCSSLTSFDIPDGVTSIGGSVFSGCHNLTAIDIPAGVKTIANAAFNECRSLTSVVIPDGVTIIESMAFSGCRNLVSVDIPVSVTSIGGGAFQNCWALTSVTIPTGVTSLEYGVFLGCSALESVVIPASVTSFDTYVFSKCGMLSKVINLSPKPQTISADVFNLSPIGSATLIVPCGSLFEYQQAAEWQNFGTIEESCHKTVSNVSATFACPGGVTVNYDLNTTDPTDVILYYSPDGGKTWLEAQTVTGDLTAQTSGSGKTIVWDNGADNVSMGRFKLRVDVPKPLPCGGDSDAVEINGVCWATRNVNTPGTFVQNPEDYGMLYQWNSNIGWSSSNPITSTDGSTWDGSWKGNGATTWETTTDVCPSGWRLPTEAELESLLEVSSQWVTRNGINGLEVGSGSNTIFLPAAGYRASLGGSLNFVGYRGSYWSDTLIIQGMSVPSVSVFYAGSTPAMSASSNGSGFAYSVRCVKE